MAKEGSQRSWIVLGRRALRTVGRRSGGTQGHKLSSQPAGRKQGRKEERARLRRAVFCVLVLIAAASAAAAAFGGGGGGGGGSFDTGTGSATKKVAEISAGGSNS